LYKDKVIRVCYRQYPCNNHCNSRWSYQQTPAPRFYKMGDLPLIDNAGMPVE